MRLYHYEILEVPQEKGGGQMWSQCKYLFMCWSLNVPQNRYRNVRVAPNRSPFLFNCLKFETWQKNWYVFWFDYSKPSKKKTQNKTKWNHKLKWLLFVDWNADDFVLNSNCQNKAKQKYIEKLKIWLSACIKLLYMLR